MRSLFASSPFVGEFQAFRLGGPQPPTLGGLLDDAEEAVNEIAKLLDGLIEEIPVGTVKSDYEKRRNACMEKSLIKRYDCLYDLFQEIKDELKKDKDDKMPPRPTLPTGDARPKESGFPYLWVGIAAAGGIALIYFITKK